MDGSVHLGVSGKGDGKGTKRKVLRFFQGKFGFRGVGCLNIQVEAHLHH